MTKYLICRDFTAIVGGRFCERRKLLSSNEAVFPGMTSPISSRTRVVFTQCVPDLELARKMARCKTYQFVTLDQTYNSGIS